jgi:hypothetical protein
MFFNLPFRGMYRPPRPGHKSISERRRIGHQEAALAAQEMAQLENISKLWVQGDEDAILKACKEEALMIGDAAYVTPTMIFNALKGYLRGQ